MLAKKEMEEMVRKYMPVWEHAINKVCGNKICLFNIRSWDAHIEHFCTDEILSDHTCF